MYPDVADANTRVEVTGSKFSSTQNTNPYNMTIMQNPQACINPPIRMDASIINNKAPSVEVKIPPAAVIAPSTNKTLAELCSFKKVMAANRGEIAVRICRGATEFNLKTATIYGT